ncbi:MAG: hypothetical protein KDD06_04160 [Phaeodactylibacter sp.]|nr:hypothetical protein [Phaeodactylibacter sp.]
MDSKYDKLKRLMSEDKPPVPPELEWEQMQDGILKKMEELQSPSKPARLQFWSKRNFFIASLSIVILFLLVICSRGVIRTHKSGPAISQGQSALGHSEWADGPSGAAATMPPQAVTERAGSRDGLCLEDTGSRLGNGVAANVPALEHPRQMDTGAQPSIKRDGAAPESRASRGASAGSKAEAIAPNSSSSREGITPLTPATPLRLTAPLQNKSAVGGSRPGERENHHLLSPIEALSARRLFVENHTASPVLPIFSQPVPKSDEAPESRAKAPGRLSLAGGVTWWNMGYGQSKPERYAYERTIISHQAGLHYTHPLKKDLALLLGLQFQQLENRFDWSAAVNDYTITLTDTVVQIQINKLTGEQTVVRGDIELTVPAKRTVRHYNTTQLFQIPLAIGKTWTVRSWQADVFIGSTLNIFSANKGRTLYQGELLDYDEASTGFANNQWKFHGMLMGRLTYMLGNYVGITGGIQFQKSLSNWSTEQNIQMRPHVIIGTIGLQYAL